MSPLDLRLEHQTAQHHEDLIAQSLLEVELGAVGIQEVDEGVLWNRRRPIEQRVCERQGTATKDDPIVT